MQDIYVRLYFKNNYFPFSSSRKTNQNCISLQSDEDGTNSFENSSQRKNVSLNFHVCLHVFIQCYSKVFEK